MTVVIWKYVLDPAFEVDTLQVPAPAELLTVQVQEVTTDPAHFAQVCAWYLVDPDQPPVTRRVALATTGNPSSALTGPEPERRYVSTFQRNGFVIHAFEVR